MVGYGWKRAPLMATALACVFGVSGPALAADCEVKVGAMGPMSGGAAAWGEALLKGVQFVVAETNKNGGLKLGDQTCEVIALSYDSKYTAEGAAAGGNYFASEGVNIIIGPVGSPEATGVKPVAERNGQITFNTSYAKDAIGPQWPLAFHGLSGPSTWAPPTIKEVKKHFDINSVIVVAPNDQGGTDIASVNAASYRDEGIDATEEYYQRGTTNFAPIVTRIMIANPDAVDTASSPPDDGATMVKQLREAGFEGPIGRLGGPGTAEIMRAVGGVEQLRDFYWHEIVPWGTPGVEAMWSGYREIMGEEAPDNTLMAPAVASARLVLAAVSQAGGTEDIEKVAEALRSMAIKDPDLGEGAWEGESFYGIAQELSFPVGMGLIKDGQDMGVQIIDVM